MHVVQRDCVLAEAILRTVGLVKSAWLRYPVKKATIVFSTYNALQKHTNYISHFVVNGTLK